MYDDVSTPRLLLRPVCTNEEGSNDLDRFHTVWSDEQATKWRFVSPFTAQLDLKLIGRSQRGRCKDLAESKAWMAGIVPLPMPTNKTRVSYFALYAESSDGFTHPTQVDEKGWKTAGIVTLLPTNFGLRARLR